MPAPAIAAAVAAVVSGLYVGVRKLLRITLPRDLLVTREADDATTVDQRTGAVRSIQSAEVTLPADRIEAMWTPMYLERLARTYWRFLTRATLLLRRPGVCGCSRCRGAPAGPSRVNRRPGAPRSGRRTCPSPALHARSRPGACARAAR